MNLPTTRQLYYTGLSMAIFAVVTSDGVQSRLPPGDRRRRMATLLFGAIVLGTMLVPSVTNAPLQ
jgi:hypothetical protein